MITFDDPIVKRLGLKIRILYENCPFKCGHYCPVGQYPTASPVPSLFPSSAPSVSPSEEPSSQPPGPPIRYCQDSPSNFLHGFEGRTKINCSKVAIENTDYRYCLEVVQENTGCGCNDTVDEFKYGSRLITCSWVIRKRCNKKRLYANCPTKCGYVCF